MSGEEEERPEGQWDDRTDFAPGLPLDPADAPETLYQALLGRVYTLQRRRDGTRSRGEVPLQQLQDLLGDRPVREGWYSASGDWLGAHPPGSLA